MKQEFTKQEDGKIRWSYEKETENFSDKDFGQIGTTGSTGYIIFENKEKALAVLDRDITESEQRTDYHKEIMDKNEYDLENFKSVKELVEAIGKLHNDFKDANNIPEHLYKQDPKKYLKILREFNNAKNYIVEEMSALNKEYDKYLKHGPAKKAYEFELEQLTKIRDQRELLLRL